MTRGIHFKNLFKKYRLKSGFATLGEFGKTLAEEGLIFEDSLFSRWQRGSRIPRDRHILLNLIKVFTKNGGINTLKEANDLLASADQGYLMEEEIQIITNPKILSQKKSGAKKIIRFANMVGKSKQILRSGWVREKIKNPESVAEHSFRLSVLSMVLGDQLGVDREKLTEMAILHDLGEVITGDLVWSRGKFIDIKKRSEKEEFEKKGIEKIFKIIGISDKYIGLYKEMIERKSEEAKIFWELDKLEMAIQALEYEKSQNKKLDEFFINADLEIHSLFVKRIMREILRQRKLSKARWQLGK